jgi:hypothetical protein
LIVNSNTYLYNSFISKIRCFEINSELELALVLL